MIAYVNGRFVPDEEASISIFDRSLLFGDAVFDTIRTFGGVPFRVEKHLARLSRSLRYMEIDPAGLIEQVRDVIKGLVERNHDQIRDVGDVFITPIVTRGTMRPGDGFGLDTERAPGVVVFLRPIDLDALGPLYTRGVDLHVSLLTRQFAGALDPRAKTTNRLSFARAELKADRVVKADPAFGRRAWVVVFDDDGTIVETTGANLCILEGERLVRPPRMRALEGISLETFCELAEQAEFSLGERKLTLYDIVNADATFLTATSFSALAVRSIDGIALDRRDDVLERILGGWIKLVDFDFVAQARERAGLATA